MPLCVAASSTHFTMQTIVALLIKDNRLWVNIRFSPTFFGVQDPNFRRIWSILQKDGFWGRNEWCSFHSKKIVLLPTYGHFANFQKITSKRAQWPHVNVVQMSPDTKACCENCAGHLWAIFEIGFSLWATAEKADNLALASWSGRPVQCLLLWNRQSMTGPCSLLTLPDLIQPCVNPVLWDI